MSTPEKGVRFAEEVVSATGDRVPLASADLSEGRAAQGSSANDLTGACQGEQTHGLAKQDLAV